MSLMDDDMTTLAKFGLTGTHHVGGPHDFGVVTGEMGVNGI